MVLFILSLSSSCPNPNIYSSRRAIKSVRNAEESDCSYLLLLFPERRVNFAIDCSYKFSYYCYTPKRPGHTRSYYCIHPLLRWWRDLPGAIRYDGAVFRCGYIHESPHGVMMSLFIKDPLGWGEWAVVMDGPRAELVMNDPAAGYPHDDTLTA